MRWITIDNKQTENPIKIRWKDSKTENGESYSIAYDEDSKNYIPSNVQGKKRKNIENGAQYEIDFIGEDKKTYITITSETLKFLMLDKNIKNLEFFYNGKETMAKYLDPVSNKEQILDLYDIDDYSLPEKQQEATNTMKEVEKVYNLFYSAILSGPKTENKEITYEEAEDMLPKLMQEHEILNHPLNHLQGFNTKELNEIKEAFENAWKDDKRIDKNEKNELMLSIKNMGVSRN